MSKFVTAPSSVVKDFETNVVPLFEELNGSLKAFNEKPVEQRLIADQQAINTLVAKAKVAVRRAGVLLNEDGTLEVKPRKNSRLLKAA